MKRIAVLLVASAAVCAAPALADEVVVTKPDVGVTVGSGPAVKEKEVIRERTPREKVIVKEHSEPTVIEKEIQLCSVSSARSLRSTISRFPIHELEKLRRDALFCPDRVRTKFRATEKKLCD